MIGWENDRGAYFINKLDERMTDSEQNIDSLTDDVESLEGTVQTLNGVSAKSYVVAKEENMTFNKPDGVVVIYVMRNSSSIYEVFVIDNWNGIKHLVGSSESITVTISEGVVTVANSSSYAVAVLVQCGISVA